MMNTKQRTRSDEDDEMFFSPMKGPLGFTVNTRQMYNFSVHINEEIRVLIITARFSIC